MPEANPRLEIPGGAIGTASDPGAYDCGVLAAPRPYHFLLVCTGNTCRSPMAEVIAKDLLKGKPGVAVSSAGVFAADGAPASVEAVEAMQEAGLDLSGHRSRYMTPELVREADVILTMTESHRQAVLAAAPEAAEKTFRLDPETDVSDPIGGPISEYRQTAAMIRRALQQRLTETQG